AESKSTWLLFFRNKRDDESREPPGRYIFRKGLVGVLEGRHGERRGCRLSRYSGKSRLAPVNDRECGILVFPLRRNNRRRTADHEKGDVVLLPLFWGLLRPER